MVYAMTNVFMKPKLYIIYPLTLKPLTLDDLYSSNKGHITLYLINGASY